MIITFWYVLQKYTTRDLKLRILTARSFCITDLNDLLAVDTDYPIIQIIHRATGSYGGTCVLGGLLILLLFFSTVTTVASASRQVWAFSRDRGFPFSSWISYVRPSREIPANAVSAVEIRTSAGTQLTKPQSWLSVSQSHCHCPQSTLALTSHFRRSCLYPTPR